MFCSHSTIAIRSECNFDAVFFLFFALSKNRLKCEAAESKTPENPKKEHITNLVA